MNLTVCCFVVVLFSQTVFSAERRTGCITPNGEPAKCLGLSSCPMLKNAIFTDSENILDFLRASQCGYDSEPLVCCGSYSSYAKRDAPCLTHDMKASTCVALSQCPIIKHAIRVQNKHALAFVRESQCGYDDEPLVCCGSDVYESEVNSTCVTPLDEPATCSSLESCPIFTLWNSTEEAKEFIAKSHCGYHNNTPLVCCGTKAPIKLIEKAIITKSNADAANGCGYQETPKILGGTITDIGEFPWMVLLRYRYINDSDAGFKCGGTLIHNRYVLTAAHCIALKASSKFYVHSVRLGEWQISSERDCYNSTDRTECADPVIDVVIEKQIPHPDFDRKNMFNDIALLELQQSVSYSAYVRPICLPSPSHNIPPLENVTKLHLSGWGSTENSSSSDFKLKVQVPIIPRNACLAMVYGVNVTDKQLCAGASGLDSCKGDSGGPIMRLVENSETGNRWYQEGIISWGIKCGIVGVYTRMTSYLDWISDVIVEKEVPESLSSRGGVLFVD